MKLIYDSDTLTPDIIGLSQDRFIVQCDHNSRGGGVALIVNTNLNPKTDQNEYNLGNCCCRDK